MKQQRLDELMALQQEIAGELSQTKIGKEFKVIIDRKEGDYYIGRTQFDSPEVDPEVLIKADDEYLKIGEFYKVKITAADDLTYTPAFYRLFPYKVWIMFVFY